MVQQAQTLMQTAAPSDACTYFRKGYITIRQQDRISDLLIMHGWQHIRIEEVSGGNTEIHATKPREVR